MINCKVLLLLHKINIMSIIDILSIEYKIIFKTLTYDTSIMVTNKTGWINSYCESELDSLVTGGVTMSPTQWAAKTKGEAYDDALMMPLMWCCWLMICWYPDHMLLIDSSWYGDKMRSWHTEIIAEAEALTNILQIYWMKNKMEILVERDTNFLQSADGHLIIVQVSFTLHHPLGR